MWNHGPAMEAVMAEKGLERPTFTGAELVDLISYLEAVSPPPLSGPLYVLPGDPEEGRLIFTERACIKCHRVQGVGGRVGPDLARRGRQWGLTEFAAAMWNKEPAMLAAMRAQDIIVPQLAAGEMADLVAYLYSVQYLAEGGDAESGRRLLQAKGCLACHSLEGRGGSLATDLASRTGMSSPAEVIATLWSHSVLMIAVEQIDVDWPTFSSEEMADVAAFFQTQSEN
jgi:cytochrome c2